MKNAQLKSALMYGAVILVAFGLGSAVSSGLKSYRKVQEENLLSGLSSQLADICISKTPHKDWSVPDILRDCVHSNTVYMVDDEFYAGWKDQPGMIQGVIDYIEGSRDSKKHYECASRSGLLIRLLREREIRARDVITPKYLPDFPDHVVVEVWNDKNGKWETQDPSHNIYFRDLEKKQRLSMEEMIALGTDRFEPCLPDGSCGWDLESDEGFHFSAVKQYWGALVRKDESGDWQVIYNKNNFDPFMELNGIAYCEHREKYCKQVPIEIGELKTRAER